MLMPKKTKFRKSHKGRRGGKASSKLEVSFGSYGLKALESHWNTARQIEASRRVMTKYTKKSGKIWIRIFPDKPVTDHGNESTMGGGKGAVDYYVVVIRPGMVLFEMDGVSEEMAKEALEAAAYKLPIKCQFVKRS